MLLCDIEPRPPKSLDEIVIRDSLASLNPRWNIDFEFNISHSHILNSSLEVNSIGVVDIIIHFRKKDERIFQENTDKVAECRMICDLTDD